uniref:Enoyl-CoA hydratase n=1 Tax=Spongospora subterranea TaxID=70186 RepID=A0A0H5QRE2_9EUKA|eukprot:CRZ04608.1 hypothetical protein [Spongospora subterranea]
MMRIRTGIGVVSSTRRTLKTVSRSMVDVTVYMNTKVAMLTLNRPKQLNALCDTLVAELNTELSRLDKNPQVKAMIVTGDSRAFAAGADIKEMNDRNSFAEVSSQQMLGCWDMISQIQKPIIAAVNGFALGGGCELAMMCDIIIAGDNAQFGQPEVLLGTIPGCGGTQRLVRAIGKSKAMEMILTGSRMTANEAERAGLICRVVPQDQLLESALELATKIASFSGPAVILAKQGINAAFEMSLSSGSKYEKSLFYSTWALEDRRNLMTAFINKTDANVDDK